MEVVRRLSNLNSNLTLTLVAHPSCLGRVGAFASAVASESAFLLFIVIPLALTKEGKRSEGSASNAVEVSEGLELPNAHPSGFLRRMGVLAFAVASEFAFSFSLSSRASALCDELPTLVFQRTTHAKRRRPPAEQSRPNQKKPAPEVQHELARPVRAGRKKILWSPFLSRGFLARAFVKSHHNRAREAPPHSSEPLFDTVFSIRSFILTMIGTNLRSRAARPLKTME